MRQLAIAALVLALLAACATPPVRLGAGDCAVFRDQESYTVIGHDCKIERVWR